MTDRKYADFSTDELETLRTVLRERKFVIRIQLDTGRDSDGRFLGGVGEDTLTAEYYKIASLAMSIGRVVNHRLDLDE